jgi:hypothetical protein
MAHETNQLWDKTKTLVDPEPTTLIQLAGRLPYRFGYYVRIEQAERKRKDWEKDTNILWSLQP